MTVLLEDLAKRLTTLEQEMNQLKKRVPRLPVEETRAERGERLLREAQAYQAQLTAGWNRALEQMGIRGEPIGAEKVQEMIAGCGFKPEDNEFSRGIIEMREE